MKHKQKNIFIKRARLDNEVKITLNKNTQIIIRYF